MLRAYRQSHQVVLVVDTAKILAKYGQVVELTHMNTGATFFKPAPRSPATFKPLTNYDRPKVAEVTIPYSVPDIMSYVIEVKCKGGG